MSQLQAAITRAQDKLEAARTRASELTASNSFPRVHQSWRHFLVSANGVFSMLEQGVKNNGSASAWFGRHKNARRTDPLLSYTHHARNADEHGVNSITGEAKPRIEFVAGGTPQATLVDLVGSGDRLEGTLNTADGGNWINPENVTELRIHPHRPSLIPVNDRGGTYNPPRARLGKPLTDDHPHAVAQHMIAYLEKMIAEAEKFLPHR